MNMPTSLPQLHTYDHANVFGGDWLHFAALLCIVCRTIFISPAINVTVNVFCSTIADCH